MSGDNFSTGDNNINISGTDIHIHGSIHQSSEMRLLRDEFGRVLMDAKRTSIVKMPLTANKSLFIGASGFLVSSLANISSIFSASPSSIPQPLMTALNTLVMPVLLVSGILLMFGIYLKRHSASMGVSFLGNVERGRDDVLYASRVKATCPYCGGKMRMLGASKYNKDHTLICNRNPEHRIEFDMTTLPDVADDYAERRAKE